MFKHDYLDKCFNYHPPKSEKTVQSYSKVNLAAKEFAKVILEEVDLTDFRIHALFAIQQAKMLANQGITIQDLEDN